MQLARCCLGPPSDLPDLACPELTAKGQRLGQTIIAEAQAAELRIAEVLGPRRFAQLRSSLELLTEVS
jgi:hypothetical protein